MANPKQAITSLLTEHFRYTPLTLLDDIINTVNELVYRAVTAVEEGLTSAPASSLGFAERAAVEKKIPDVDEDGSVLYPESRAEIEHGVHQLETLLESTVDKNFDKLEIFMLRSILNVPEDLSSWLRLPHYENLDFTSQSDVPTPQSLHLVRRKLHETRKLQNALLAERSRNTILISQLKSLLTAPTTAPDSHAQPQQSLSFLTTISSARTAQGDEAQLPLTKQTQAAISQLPALRQLLETLRPRVGTLTAQKPGAAAEERRDYIENQTRQRLERGGANVKTGEGLSGPYAHGPRIGGEEVHGIETVAGILEQGENADVMEE